MNDNNVTLFPSITVFVVVKTVTQMKINPKGVSPYSGLYREAPSKTATFVRLRVYKRVWMFTS